MNFLLSIIIPVAVVAFLVAHLFFIRIRGNSTEKKLRVLSWFIRIISVVYIVFGSILIIPIPISLISSGLVAIIFSFFLPITHFGNPFALGIDIKGVNENMLPIFATIALVSGIVAFWSGILIKKLRIAGMCMYTGVVSLLAVGIFLDFTMLDSKVHYQSGIIFLLSYFMFDLFLLSIWYGWRQFYLLGKQKKIE